MQKQCDDRYPCALPDPKTGKYGTACDAFDLSLWPPGMRTIATLVQCENTYKTEFVNTYIMM